MNKVEAIAKATNSVLAGKVLMVAGKKHELARCAFIHLALEAGATVPEVANAIKATHAVVCGENILVRDLVAKGDKNVMSALSAAQIEECLRECGGPQLDEVEGGIGYLVQTPEPWTADEVDFLRGIAEKKEKI